MYASSGNEITFELESSGESIPVTTTNPLNGNAWVHVVGVRDNGSDQLLLYLNGSLGTVATDDSDGSLDATAYPIMGDGPTCCFQGMLDKV